MSLLLSDLVDTSAQVRATPSRIVKRRVMAELFVRLAPGDLALAVSYLSGEIPQGRLGVGWKAVASALEGLDAGAQEVEIRVANLSLPFPPAAVSTGSPDIATPLTIADTDRAFQALAENRGPGSTRRAAEILADLFRRTDQAGRDFLVALIAGELRQGALRAVVREAVAEALGVDPAAVLRAEMFGGDLAQVTTTLRAHGTEALSRFALQPMVPVAPMLAQSVSTAEEAAQGPLPVATEPKLDGVRIQLHKLGKEVRVYTRQLRDVTRNVPELVARGPELHAESAILDGEALVLGPTGRPLPFQETMSRVGRDLESTSGMGRRLATPLNGPSVSTPRLTALFFDLLYRDGEALIDRPGDERRRALLDVTGGRHVVPQTLVDSAAALAAELEHALAAGHEGLVVKSIAAPYTAGRRGGQWRKLKPAVTLDLVILAAEWGHGRRRGVLSNLHLGARDTADPHRFWMLGKTFKGLTDEMLRTMTEDLLAIATSDPEQHVVKVRPERVVEIAFDTLQRSPRYDSGLALRFARVKRFRPDKSPAEATTLDEIRAIFSAQGGARPEAPASTPQSEPPEET
jgi:DNA ligase-1